MAGAVHLDAVRRERLLGLARASLDATVRGLPVRPASDELAVDVMGVFVTLHCEGDLRGCLGALDLEEPVAAAVARLASAVSREDHRFAPIAPDELARVRIEISLLAGREPLEHPDHLEIGRHGLIVERGWRRGLLLPQVAIEHRWDRETFLAHACLKATLPPDAWRRGASVFRFEAFVFGEHPA